MAIQDILRRPVPLVGEPGTVHGWFPTVLMNCNCATKPPMMIVGLGTVGECPACHRKFVVTNVHYDGRTGESGVAVAAMAPSTGQGS